MMRAPVDDPNLADPAFLMPPPGSGKRICAWCRRWRDPDELVPVERIATGIVRYLCRRLIRPQCMRAALGSRDVDRLIPESERTADR